MWELQHTEKICLFKKIWCAPKMKKDQTVYERLSKMSGIQSKRKETREKDEVRKKANEEIKQVMDKNFRDEIIAQYIKEGNIWRVQFDKKFPLGNHESPKGKEFTQEQLADAIGESELAIRMAERGMLPRERERLVKKLENYLKIRITNAPYSEPSTEQPQEVSDEVPIEEIKKKFSIRELLGLKKKMKEEENE